MGLGTLLVGGRPTVMGVTSPGASAHALEDPLALQCLVTHGG